MATRNGRPVSLSWLHLDTTHPQYSGVVRALRAVHEASGDIRLSVNEKSDGTQALIKLLGVMPTLSPAQSGCVIRTYTEGDHAEIMALVTKEVDDPAGSPGRGWVRHDSEGRELINAASNPLD